MTDPFLDHPNLSARYFYPWPNHLDEPFLVQGDGFVLACRYRRVGTECPTIIHFHGNGEFVDDYLGEFEERIAAMGANLLLAEYRGYGMSSGTPALADMLDDVRLLVEASGAAPERIIFFGRSLGSLYAVHGASLYPRAAGLIVESGIADPLERILMRIEPRHVEADEEQLRSAVRRHLNQRRKIVAFHGRVMIMHARRDDMVDVSHAKRLYSWACQPKELVLFERGDHATILAANREAYFSAIRQFIAGIPPAQG